MRLRALATILFAGLPIYACGSDGGGETVTDAGTSGSSGTVIDSGTSSSSSSGGNDAAVDSGPPDNLLAGAAKVDATPKIGVPLGGYGGRMSGSVDLDPTNDVTFFKPSTGVRDPIYCKALILSDGKTKVGFMSVDGVGIIGAFVNNVLTRAKSKGYTVPDDNNLMFASHSHSGPAAVTTLKFWQFAAMDLYVKRADDEFSEACATALANAEKAMVPAKLGTGFSEMKGVSKNRRADRSPWLDSDTVDPTLGLLRVEKKDGTPIAVLWNFAIHGTALGADNLKFSADVMGQANTYIEQKIPGVVSLFMNGAEGDTSPDYVGDAENTMTALGTTISDKVKLEYGKIATHGHIKRLASKSAMVDFGQPKVTILPESVGGELNLGSLGPLLGAIPGVPLSLGSDFSDRIFRMQAIRLEDDVFASVPGEALYEVGQQIKKDGKDLGFAHVFVAGLANGHMGYAPSKREYDLGGYEVQVTLFGDQSGQKVIDGCKARMTDVK
ncbi:MAG: neutral/alkaline non-lysosomal ceramidase N-terminal domain-containing protein [Polyangiaceae bacterium]